MVGGWQFLLMLVTAVLGVVCHDESKHLLLFLCGLAFLTASAICGIGGTMALGET